MEEIKEILLQNGYDVIINKENIILLKDGFSYSFPVKNVIKIIDELQTFKLPLSEVASLLEIEHNTKKCLERGENLLGRKISKDELFDELKNNFDGDK